MRLALVDDHADGFDLHVVADDRRLRALAEVCSKGGRPAEAAMREMGASVAGTLAIAEERAGG